MGVTDLAVKHGCPNTKAIYRQVALMEQQPACMVGIELVSQAVPGILTNAARISEGEPVSAALAPSDSVELDPTDKYRRAMAQVTWDVHKQGKSMREACS